MDIFIIKTSVENSGHEKLYYNYYFILDKNHEFTSLMSNVRH